MKKITSVLLICTLIIGIFSFSSSAAFGFKSGDFKYIIGLGEAVITECNSGVTGKVIIPEKINNLPVKTIGDNAFEGCTGITEITMPDSIIKIGQFAFNNCSSLEKITLSSGIKQIGMWAFAGCKQLKKLRLPDGITKVTQNMLAYCMSLTSVIIPEGVTTIEDMAFGFCTGLETLSIPDSVSKIGSFAFSYCLSLKSVRLPENISSLETDVFYNAGLNSVEIPYSVKTVNEDAFEDCNSLATVTVLNPKCKINKSSGTMGNVIICGYEGSTAEKYAKNNDLDFIKLTGEPHAHEYSAWTVSKKATATKTGTMTRTCIKCGKVDTKKTYSTDLTPENCTCMCHKSGFTKLIYTFIKIGWQIQGINRLCKCGDKHW